MLIIQWLLHEYYYMPKLALNLLMQGVIPWYINSIIIIQVYIIILNWQCLPWYYAINYKNQ